MDEILIRRVRNDDADEIIRIEAAITQEPGELDLRPIIEERSERRGDANFVAELEGKVIGYMFSSITSGSFGVNKSAWISVLGVDPKFMGQGIGKKLAETIFKYYREQGIKDVFTSVKWDYADQLSFFKTLGFERSDFLHLRKGLD